MEREMTWLETSLKDPKVKQEFAREWLVESFLTALEQEMTRQEVSRQELAKRMGCALPNVSRAFRRVSNLTTKTMANMALALNLGVSTKLEEFPDLQACPDSFQIQISTCEFITPVLGGMPSSFNPWGGSWLYPALDTSAAIPSGPPSTAEDGDPETGLLDAA
jgi:transcriptional regulator with XRE-family HTH domain